MYVEDWDSFLQMAEALFRQAPLRTRYVLKYRHCDGKLVLKVTDDVAVSSHSPFVGHCSCADVGACDLRP